MIKIQSLRGDLSIFDITYGDMVYNIHGKEVKVIGDKYYKKAEVYRVHYNDGRSSLHLLKDFLHTDYGRMVLKDLINKSIKPNVTLYQIPYGTRSRDILIPDPYVQGALLSYGDTNKEFINLPIGRNKVYPHLMNKYQMTYAELPIKDSLAFFRYQGNNSHTAITWREFFYLDDNLFARDGSLPLKIKRATINDRWQFVRGAFDIGYDPSLFNEEQCGICHKSLAPLMRVQSLLWGLGINSTISEDVKDNQFKWRYRLAILGDATTFPNNFYNIDNRETMITNRTSVVKYPMSPFQLKIKKITLDGERQYRELILDRPSVYIDIDFLPRISL